MDTSTRHQLGWILLLVTAFAAALYISYLIGFRSGADAVGQLCIESLKEIQEAAWCLQGSESSVPGNDSVSWALEYTGGGFE